VLRSEGKGFCFLKKGGNGGNNSYQREPQQGNLELLGITTPKKGEFQCQPAGRGVLPKCFPMSEGKHLRGGKRKAINQIRERAEIHREGERGEQTR